MAIYSITANNTVPYPDEINDDFYHCAQGTVYPMDGNYLSYTTGSVNIGNSTTVWKTIYANNITNTSINYTVGQTWKIAAEFIFTSTTGRVEISGLNGDVDTDYKIFVYMNNNANSTYWLYPNGNSSYSTCYQALYSLAGAIGAYRGSGSGITIGDITAARNIAFTVIDIYGKTSECKTFQTLRSDTTYATLTDLNSVGQTYAGSATTATITSFVFATSAGNFNAASYILILKRGK